MPIHPENAHRYPPDWPDISRRIRFERAEGRCECTGQCGTDHAAEQHRLEVGRVDATIEPEQRCRAEHGRAHPVTGSVVVLTTAHLDHTPENVDDANLLAMCQRCHLRYDRDHHAESRARRAAEALAASGQQTLNLNQPERTTMKNNLNTLNALADRGLADSARWFPELHERGQLGLAVHYALGLGGEAGELLDDPGSSHELADVVIYALDLGRILGADLDAAYDRLPADVGPPTPQRIAVHAGLALNYTKKLNRGDRTVEDVRDDIAEHVAMIVALARNIVGDLLGAIEEKRTILLDRWEP